MKLNGHKRSDLAEFLIQAQYGKSSRANAACNLRNVAFQAGYAEGQRVSLTEQGCFESTRIASNQYPQTPEGREQLRDFRRGLWSARYQIAT